MEKSGKITESEWQVMEVIWERGMGITQPELMNKLGDRWNKNTVHTFLKRLCDKGFLAVEKEETPHRYRALIDRESCVKEERQSFVERVYQGSVGRMVASFVRDGELSGKEVAELRKLLDELEGKE